MTNIDHLNPPTGHMADNVVGFARALRAAGIPVGPGAVIDALNALQAIEIGNRADVYATLEAIFVKRREHMLIFAQAFDLFFRAAEDWKHMLDSVPLPDHAKKKPPPASRRVQEALAQPSMREEAPQAQEQELRLSVSDKEILQKKDFAQMSAAEIAEVTRAIADMKLPQAELRTRRYQPDAKGLRLDMRRTLRSSLRTGGEIIDIRKLGPIDKPGADRGAAGYIRLDERIYPPVPAFPARHHRRPQARLRVPVRHAADQCDAFLAGTRSRRGAGELFVLGGGLGRRDEDRDLAAQLQQIVGPPGARPGRDRSPYIRRARTGGR